MLHCRLLVIPKSSPFAAIAVFISVMLTVALTVAPLVALMVSLMATSVFAQPTAEQRKQAQEPFYRCENKIHNLQLRVHWLDKNSSQFWYEWKEDQDKSEFWLVDPVKGEKTQLDSKPDFRHEANSSDSNNRRDFDNRRFQGLPRDITPESDKRDSDKHESEKPERPENAFQDTNELLVQNDNIWVVSKTDASQRRQLTFNGTPENTYLNRFIWSADGQKVLVFVRKPEQVHTVQMVQSSPDSQLQPLLFSHQYLKPGDRITQDRVVLFNFTRGEQMYSPIEIDTTLFSNPWSLEPIGYRPSADEFHLIYNQRGHQVMRVLAISAKDGTVRTIVEEKSETFIDYAHKRFFRYYEPTQELIWMSERDGWNHLYLYDTTTGTVKNQITCGDWLVRHVEFIDWTERRVYVSVMGFHKDQDPYFTHLASVNFDGSDLKILTDGDGNHQYRWSPDQQYFVDTCSRVDTFPVHQLRDREGNLVMELDRADGTALLAAGWRAPERFTAPGRDGVTPVYGLIWRPSHFDPQKKYPVLENIYAGPQDYFVPKSFRTYYPEQELAELGFIVVQCDGMGTNWRSRAFHDVCWKNLRDAGFPDRIAWIRAAAEQDSALDLTRVGLYGTSAGGQSAVGALLWHNDFYKAAVANCGCHDNRMDKIWWNELWMGWPVGPEYAENSNVVNAGLLKGNLLLIVGEMDRNVDPASTMQLVNALIKADKDFDMIVVPNADHGCGKYARRRTVDYLYKALGAQAP